MASTHEPTPDPTHVETVDEDTTEESPLATEAQEFAKIIGKLFQSLAKPIKSKPKLREPDTFDGSDCHDPFPELSPIYIHTSRSALVHYQVHLSRTPVICHTPRVLPDHIRLRCNAPSPDAIGTIKNAGHSVAPVPPRPRG